MESIIVALISGVLALAGTILSVNAGNKHIEAELDKHNAIQDERIRALTEAVNRHNDFASRIPRLEQRIEDMSKRLDKIEEHKEV